MHDEHEEQQRKSETGPESPARAAAQPASEPPKKSETDDPDKKFTVGGYVETFYQYNFNNPGNGISNYRGYDDRHNTLTLQNAVVDVGFRAHELLGRIAIQTGTTPSSMFSEDTSLPGTDAAGETSPALWRHLQRASVGWQVSSAVLLEAGLFVSNVNIESIPVKENWNWSRSSLSTRMPNYFSGARMTVSASKRLDVSAMVVNGWNKVVDDNDEKTGIVQAIYRVSDTFTGSLSYVGGVEREGGAQEGRAYRHLADAWIQAKLSSVVSVGADGTLGGEHTRYGLHWFAGAAGYGRIHLLDPLWLALRVDRLWEDPAGNVNGVSRPILIDAKDVTSFAATLDYRPLPGISLRVEGRHDRAAADLFFKGAVAGAGTPESPYVTDARRQTTALLGLVAWF